MDIYSTFNNSGIDDFESLISSSLSNDLSMEIGQIMGQMELNNASRESKTAKANIEKRDLDRFRSLEKSVGGIQSKLDAIVSRLESQSQNIPPQSNENHSSPLKAAKGANSSFPTTKAPTRRLSTNIPPPQTQKKSEHISNMSLQLDSVCSELDQLKRSLGIQADPKVSLREIHLARKELEDTQIKPPSQKSRIVPQVIKNEFDIEDLKALITKIVREQVQQALLVFEKNRMSNILAQFSLEIEARLEKKFLGLQADTSRSATPTKSNMVRKLTPADKNVDAIFGKLKTKFAQKSKLAHPKAAPKSATAKRAYQSHTQSSVLKKKI